MGDELRVTHVGHATVLLQPQGLNVLAAKGLATVEGGPIVNTGSLAGHPDIP